MKKTLLNIALFGLLSASAVAQANTAGDIIVRAGVTHVAPTSDQPTIYAAGKTVHQQKDGPAFQASVEDDTQLGLNLAYFVTDNIAIELLAATPFSHDINVHVGDTKLNLGSTKHLPPTLSALYYFADNSAKFQPYVGLGINYTVFFDDKFNSTIGDTEIRALNNEALAAPVKLNAQDLNLKNSWGLSAQVGVDYYLDSNWMLNASARYIDIDTTATFTAVDGTIPGKVSVDINPWVYTLSIGYKF